LIINYILALSCVSISGNIEKVRNKIEIQYSQTQLITKYKLFSVSISGNREFLKYTIELLWKRIKLKEKDYSLI